MNRKIRTVISLFDGISCGKVALDKEGIQYERYYACEIDKYAVKVADSNHPDIIQMGDILNWYDWDINWDEVDLVIGGSPCQGFSLAGKQLNFNDPRSKLFFVFVDILKYVRSRNPRVLFLLENVKMRKDFREIITDIVGIDPIEINSSLVSAQQRRRLYWTNIPNINQPKDRNIFLKDIIQSGIVAEDKAYALTTRYAGYSFPHDFIRKKKSCVFEPLVIQRPRGKNKGIIIKDKSPTMTSSQWVYNNHLAINIPDGSYEIRKFTPIECERLQTLPDNYTSMISDSQRYKCLGNGWTVDVIAHIFNQMKEDHNVERKF